MFSGLVINTPSPDALYKPEEAITPNEPIPNTAYGGGNDRTISLSDSPNKIHPPLKLTGTIVDTV